METQNTNKAQPQNAQKNCHVNLTYSTMLMHCYPTDKKQNWLFIRCKTSFLSFQSEHTCPNEMKELAHVAVNFGSAIFYHAIASVPTNFHSKSTWLWCGTWRG